MNHLITYKIFESVLNFLPNEEIEDILQDLLDIGFFINVSPTPLTITNRSKKNEFFIYIDKDERESYLKNRDEFELLVLSLQQVLDYVNASGFETRSFFYDNSSFNMITESLISGEKTLREILEFTFKGDVSEVDIGEWIFFKFRQR